MVSCLLINVIDFTFIIAIAAYSSCRQRWRYVSNCDFSCSYIISDWSLHLLLGRIFSCLSFSGLFSLSFIVSEKNIGISEVFQYYIVVLNIFSSNPTRIYFALLEKPVKEISANLTPVSITKYSKFNSHLVSS